MAVVLVGNGAAIGFMQAIETTRPLSSASKTDPGYVALAAAALAFKTEFLALNAASAVPLADAEGSVDLLVAGAVNAAMEGRSPPLGVSGGASTVATDYATIAAVALALAQSQIGNVA